MITPSMLLLKYLREWGKWEVSKSATGALNRKFYMGKPRSINYKPYPLNYGIIPNTVLPLRVGGDGGPLDALVLGPSLTQGDVVKVKVLGVIRMKDFERMMIR